MTSKILLISNDDLMDECKDFEIFKKRCYILFVTDTDKYATYYLLNNNELFKFQLEDKGIGIEFTCDKIEFITEKDLEGAVAFKQDSKHYVKLEEVPFMFKTLNNFTHDFMSSGYSEKVKSKIEEYLKSDKTLDNIIFNK